MWTCQPIWTHFLLRRISLKRSYLCIILKIVLGFLTIPSLSSQSFILRYPYVLLLDSCFAESFLAKFQIFCRVLHLFDILVITASGNL